MAVDSTSTITEGADSLVAASQTFTRPAVTPDPTRSTWVQFNG